jgi:cation diffusion facilitator family transporter
MMQRNQNKRKLRLILLSFVTSLVLCGIKFLAYFLTNSNAILSDALESIINVIASAFAFYSIQLSAQPKDRNHPYGHGKIEFVSAGFEGALIATAAFLIGYQAIIRLLEPAPLENLSTGSWLIAFSVIANTVLGYVLINEGKKTNSLALIADGRHLLSDSISSVLLLISVILLLITKLDWIDSVASILFSFIILYNGLQLLRKSLAGLMDETDEDLLEKVVETIRSNKKTFWVDVHNLRVQQYGSDLHIDCHLTLPYYWELQKAHEAIHDFENILKAGHNGETEIFVHADPCLPECCHFCRLEECPVRSHPFQQEIKWDTVNLSKNQKLYTTKLF